MIPDKKDQKWKELLTGKVNVDVKVWSTRMMLTKAIDSVKQDPSPANIQKNINEAYEYFQKFDIVAAKDIEAIFGNKGNSP
jgi:hypothetical protein